jgi:hypothetical protein
MIIGLPTSMREFAVSQDVPQSQQIAYAHTIGRQGDIRAPIRLKTNDHIWIDLQTNQVHIVERGGIVIWRSGWLN